MEDIFDVKQAESSDYETVQTILVETAKWLNKKGSSQWKGLLEGNDVHDTAEAIERGEVYLAKESEEIVGMFILWDEQTEWDKGLWGEENTKEYYYLHRITIEKNHHGKGLGSKLVNTAIAVAQKDGKREVRLDCIQRNEYLNQFYRRCNFKFVKTVFNHEGAAEAKDFNLYKKPID